MTSYFFRQAEKNQSNAEIFKQFELYADSQKALIYILNSPLTDQKYSYDYSKSFIVLSPKHKIAIIDYVNNLVKFKNYVEDVVEDIGSIADKYQYKSVIERPRQWIRY